MLLVFLFAGVHDSRTTVIFSTWRFQFSKDYVPCWLHGVKSSQWLCIKELHIGRMLTMDSTQRFGQFSFCADWGLMVGWTTLFACNRPRRSRMENKEKKQIISHVKHSKINKQ